MQQVRHHQQRLGDVEERRAVALQREKLEQRVEANELNAGPREKPLRRALGKSQVHRAFGMWVAVVARVAEQCPAAAEQREVNAPGVDAKAIDAAELSR